MSIEKGNIKVLFSKVQENLSEQKKLTILTIARKQKNSLKQEKNYLRRKLLNLLNHIMNIMIAKNNSCQQRTELKNKSI